MKVDLKITGWNYTGHHFRGLPSPYDEVLLNVRLRGEETDVVEWILENFSYGPQSEVRYLEELVSGYRKYTIPNADGCGGVIRILDNSTGDAVFEQEEMPDYDQPLDLGTYEVAEDRRDWEEDLLNTMVRTVIDRMTEQSYDKLAGGWNG